MFKKSDLRALPFLAVFFLTPVAARSDPSECAKAYGAGDPAFLTEKMILNYGFEIDPRSLSALAPLCALKIAQELNLNPALSVFVVHGNPNGEPPPSEEWSALVNDSEFFRQIFKTFKGSAFGLYLPASTQGLPVGGNRNALILNQQPRRHTLFHEYLHFLIDADRSRQKRSFFPQETVDAELKKINGKFNSQFRSWEKIEAIADYKSNFQAMLEMLVEGLPWVDRQNQLPLEEAAVEIFLAQYEKAFGLDAEKDSKRLRQMSRRITARQLFAPYRNLREVYQTTWLQIAEGTGRIKARFGYVPDAIEFQEGLLEKFLKIWDVRLSEARARYKNDCQRFRLEECALENPKQDHGAF